MAKGSQGLWKIRVVVEVKLLKFVGESGERVVGGGRGVMELGRWSLCAGEPSRSVIDLRSGC